MKCQFHFHFQHLFSSFCWDIWSTLGFYHSSYFLCIIVLNHLYIQKIKGEEASAEEWPGRYVRVSAGWEGCSGRGWPGARTQGPGREESMPTERWPGVGCRSPHRGGQSVFGAVWFQGSEPAQAEESAHLEEWHGLGQQSTEQHKKGLHLGELFRKGSQSQTGKEGIHMCEKVETWK